MSNTRGRISKRALAAAGTLLAGTVGTGVLAAATQPAAAQTRAIAKPRASVSTVSATSRTSTSTVSYPSAHAPFAVGISPGSDVLWQSGAQVASTMHAMAAAGDKWVRIDVDWAAVESSPNQYNWSSSDTAISDAVKNGLTVDAILDYAPSWAVVNSQPSASAYGTFATAAVKHYSAMGVHVYEVWNEENLGWTWNNAVNVASYGQLLQSGFKAIHAADSHAVVLLGGLGRGPDMTDGEAIDPYDFLSQLYADGFGRYFDAVNVHPYSAPEAPLTDDPYNNPFYDLPSYYSLMQSYGDGAKKIWVTEYGYPTAGTDSVTEQQQADYLTTAIEAIMGQSWAGPFFIYNWQDDSTQNFGLLRADGSAKPALTVFEESPH